MTTELRTEDVTAFHKHAEWTGVSSDDQVRWLELRKTMVTASDVAAVMGEDDLKSAIEVFAEKTTEAPTENLPPWHPLRVGTLFEQPLLRDVAAYRGWNYRPGGKLLRSRKYPCLGATLDAEVERGDGVWCDFEGKTTELVGDWKEETGQMPTRVLLQVQTQLLVTGAEVGIVFALLRRYKPVQIEVYRNERLHEVIGEYSERFIDMVRRGERPEPDGSKSARRALRRLFPLENGDIVDLPPEAVGWTRDYQDISEEIRALELRKTHLQNLLKNTLGGATYGLLPEDVGGKSTWRWQTLEGKPGDRRLLALKDPPPGHRYGGYPRGLAKASALVSQLEASTEEAPANVIRFGSSKRRRTRR